MPQNFTPGQSFKVRKAASDHLIIEISDTTNHDSFFAVINDVPHKLTPIEASIDLGFSDFGTIFRLNFDFLSCRVDSIFLATDRCPALQDTTNVLKLLFQHDADTIHQQIQMRGMPVSGGLRYVASLQSALWCLSESDKLPRGDFLRLSSYCLCCSVYRLIENGMHGGKARDRHRVSLRIKNILDSITLSDMSPDEARWYPSLCYAMAQLDLCQLDRPACVGRLELLVSHQEAFLALSPITAYNLSLACCLLSALAANYAPDRFDVYATYWHTLLRQYPALMEIRLGTIIELKHIYDAWLLSERLHTQFKSMTYQDHRFTPVLANEILHRCLRAQPPEHIVRRIIRDYLPCFANNSRS